ncbi:hypothetical protein FF18_11590 [Elizabethkingia anophelis]|nr:hypothetical protein FF18_11590 [Elizabethkingia anophelis]
MQVIAKQKTYSLNFRGAKLLIYNNYKKNKLYSEHNKKYTFLFSEAVAPYFQNTYQTLFNFHSIIGQI